MAYGLVTSEGFLTADAVIAKLDPSIAFQNAHIQSIRDLVAAGCRYSNEDCDVLGAALSAVGKIEAPPWETKWVEVMNAKAARG